MKKLLTPFKVGLVVIASVVAFIFMYGVVDTSLDEDQGTYRVYAIFSDATGLAARGQVQMAGIKIGEIEQIELLETEAKARVTVRLENRIKLRKGYPPTEEVAHWRDGATIAKKQASPVVGTSFLELTPGVAGDLMQDGDQIVNVDSGGGFDALFQKLEKITTDISKVTDSLAKTFGSEEGQRSLQQILGRLEEIATTISAFINENEDELGRIVTNADSITSDVKVLTSDARQDFRKILADAQAITREVRYIIGQSGADVQEGLGSLKGTLQRLSTTLDSLNYTLQNVSEITDKVNEGEGSLGKLINDPTLAEETEKMVSDVGDFVERIVELKTILELRGEYYLRQNALKNYIALRLQPKDDKYYLIELVDDPRGRTTPQQVTTYSTDPSQPDVVREESLTTTDSFKFSLQIAKRWGFFTGRFGLIESSGGVGANLNFFNDNLEIRTDVFDFGEAANPRLRVGASYSPFQYFFLVGGLDDVLNDETFDFFLGLMVRFNDEDLITILASSPSPSFQ